MKTARFAAALVAASALFAPAARAGFAPADPKTTLCLSGEYPAFTCDMKQGEKKLSICLHDASVVYRFGKLGKVELEFPGDSEAPSFVRTQSPYPEGIETVLGFDRGNTHYAIDDEEDKTTASASAAWITVSRKGKTIARLDCAPGMKASWALLDNLLPAIDPGAVPVPAAVPAAAEKPKAKAAPAASPGGPGAPSASTPAAAAKPAAPGAVLECDTHKARPMTDYRKLVTSKFRGYVEQTEPLFAFATEQFGAPQGCALTLDPTLGKFPSDSPDETSFNGTLTYFFNGALLTLVYPPADFTLRAENGFPDEAAAKKALEERAGSKPSAENGALSDDHEAGTTVTTWAGSEDADGTGDYADEKFRGKKLIAIRIHP